MSTNEQLDTLAREWQRYGFYTTTRCGQTFEELTRDDEDGEWVRYEDASAALARAYELGQPQWQPITTAPKDGTRILATWVQTWAKHPHVEVCEWASGMRWVYTYDGDAPSDREGQPTHWMPLPPAPKEQP